MEPESSHAEQIYTIRALVTRVRQSLHLMTQRAQGNAYAAGEINTRLRPLALTRALDFLRGLQLWLPVSWRPDAFAAPNALAHDALRYEYRRKRVPPKRGIRRPDTSVGEQDEWQEPAPSLPENALDENSADESDVMSDDTAPPVFPALASAVEQLETIAQSLGVTAPHVESGNPKTEIFSGVPAFPPTEFFERDLAAEYTRQLGLAALSPLVSPRAKTTQADTGPTFAQSSAELLPIADLDFAPQVQELLSTLADATTIDPHANFTAPRARPENERVLRFPRPRTARRALVPPPSPDHAAIPQTPAETDDERRTTDRTDGAIFQTPTESPAAHDRIAETAHSLFAARMNLSASPIAPDAVALADEIAVHHLPLAEQGALAQISLPRMFAELFLAPHIAPDVSEFDTADADSASASSPRAQPQIELRTAQPQRVLTRIAPHISVPASAHTAQETSNADETNSIAETEHTPINFTPSVEAAGALSLHADAHLENRRAVFSRSELTNDSAPGATFAVSLPPFRLSDEIRARVTGFPNLFADAHDDESRAVIAHTALSEPISAAPLPRVMRGAAARSESRRAFHFPSPITRAAPSNDFISLAAFPGDESTHSRLSQQDWRAPARHHGVETSVQTLAHGDVPPRAFAPPPASPVDEPDSQIEKEAAPFAVSANARADHSAFSFRTNNSIPAGVLFQTIAQPLNTLALHQNTFGETGGADSSFPISSPAPRRDAPTETRDASPETRAPESRVTPRIAPPPPMLGASAFASAPNMELRQSATLPAAQREPAEPSPAAWHGSISDSILPELSVSRAQDFSSRASDEYAAPRDAPRGPVSDSAPAPRPAASAPVDVSVLAQQVYTLLKTELRAERERHQLYRR